MSATDPAATKSTAHTIPHRRSFDELFGAAVGACAQLVRMPLPFVLGPLVATAALGLAGQPVVRVRRLRPGAQFVIGSAIGIQFTHAVVARLALLLPLIVGSAVMSIAVCA